MIEGAMARGEVSPGNYTYDWVWVPRVRNNHTVPIRSIGVKNIFINRKMKVCIHNTNLTIKFCMFEIPSIICAFDFVIDFSQNL